MNSIIFYISILILVFFNKTSGNTGILFAGILFLSFFQLYKMNLTYAFLLCVVICANPGLILNGNSFGLTIHLVRFIDVFFYLSFLILFSPTLKKIKLDYRIRKLFPLLITFILYQILVSLIIKLDISSFWRIFKKIEELKFFIFGILILVPAYKIIQLDSILFIRTIIILALIYATVFLLSMYTPYKIIGFATEIRIKGSGLIRIMIQNAEIFKLSVLIAIAAYFTKKQTNKGLFYLAGILTFSIPVIGMYRLELIYTIATILMVMVFVNNNSSMPVFKYFKLLLYSIICLVTFFIVFPKFSIGLISTFTTTFNELFGNTAIGTTQTRTVIELPKHLVLINRNLFFGVGFRNEWWSNYYNKYDWGLSDIPLTSTLAMYGIIGMAIYYSRFIILFSTLRFIHQIIKKNKFIIDEINNIEILTIFAISAYFISMISFRLFYIGWELTLARLQFEFGVFIGIYYGLINKILLKDKNKV